MERRKKVRILTTVVCLAASLSALYAFCFLVDVSNGWRIILILLAVSWIVSCVTGLHDCLKQ